MKLEVLSSLIISIFTYVYCHNEKTKETVTYFTDIRYSYFPGTADFPHCGQTSQALDLEIPLGKGKIYQQSCLHLKISEGSWQYTY